MNKGLKLSKNVHFGHLCDISDEIFGLLLSLTGNWKLFKSRGKNSRYIEQIHPLYIPIEYKFLENIILHMIKKIKEIAKDENVIFLQMLMCYYSDEKSSTGMHKHNCRSMTVSLGFPREFKVNTKILTLNNGDYIILYKHSHGVPKLSKNIGPRISLNLFYCYETDKNVNIKG